MTRPHTDPIPFRTIGVVVLVAFLWISFQPAAANEEPYSWTETFDGDPTSPQVWNSPDWDIQYHTRNATYWAAPEAMPQQHGSDCSAPPMTHPASSWPGTVYQCRDHLMTAINATDYGLIYLTPNRMADWSAGPAVVQWEMSTEAASQRDWVDLLITPYDQNQAHPLEVSLPDLQGKPRDYLHVDLANNEHAPIPRLGQNGAESTLGEQTWTVASVRSGIRPGTNEAATRQTFRLTLSSTSATFERLASESAPAIVFWDKTFPPLNFTSGVVQFGHHSYTPWKDGNGGPQTYHWDNVTINPSIPFTMIKSDIRYVTTDSQIVSFDSPAPRNSHLRFSALGNVAVSFDGGPFEMAKRQWEQGDKAEHASSYWHPVPEGIRSVRFQFSQRDWWNGPNFIAKDITVWSLAMDSPGERIDDPVHEPSTTSDDQPVAADPPQLPGQTDSPVSDVTPSEDNFTIWVPMVAALVVGVGTIGLGTGWWLRRRRFI